MRISDWSSDVCSSDLLYLGERVERVSLGRESTPESTDGVAIGALDPVRDAIPLLPRQRCVRRDGAVLVRSPGHRSSSQPIVGPPGAGALVTGPVADGPGSCTPGPRPPTRPRFIRRVAGTWPPPKQNPEHP